MIYKEDKGRILQDTDDIKEIVRHVNDMFSEYWIKTISYGIYRLEKMQSKKIRIPRSLHQILRYAQAINDYFDKRTGLFEKISEDVLHEAVNWEKEGGYCIHMSILVKTLLDVMDPKESKKLKYYQGFATLITENVLASMLFGNKQLGIHSWLCYENGVIDVTSNQHQHSIRLPDNQYGMIIGEMPTTYVLQGFKENEKVIGKYQEMFAEKMNLESKEKWIAFHVKAFNEFLRS